MRLSYIWHFLKKTVYEILIFHLDIILNKGIKIIKIVLHYFYSQSHEVQIKI